jgi:hypothetical protein
MISGRALDSSRESCTFLEQRVVCRFYDLKRWGRQSMFARLSSANCQKPVRWKILNSLRILCFESIVFRGFGGFVRTDLLRQYTKLLHCRWRYPRSSGCGWRVPMSSANSVQYGSEFVGDSLTAQESLAHSLRFSRTPSSLENPRIWIL